MNYIFKFKNELKNRNYAERTIKLYSNKLEKYLSHIKYNLIHSNSDRISSFIANINCVESRRHTYSAVKFFYRYVLKIECPYTLNKIRKRKRKIENPSKEEVLSILNEIKNRQHYLMIALMYSSGLRPGELINLKVADIDLNSLRIFIKNSKQHKDRYTVFSDKLIKNLQENMKNKNTNDFLFLTVSNKKYAIRTVQVIFKKALNKSGIKKKYSCKSLRHAFASHCLEQGIDIRIIQKLLGHKSIKTTMVYLYNSDIFDTQIKSPL